MWICIWRRGWLHHHGYRGGYPETISPKKRASVTCSKQFGRMIRAGRAKFTVRCLDWRYLQKPLFSLLFSLRKTRGIGDLASYQSSPSSGSSPQPPSTIARSSTRSAVPSSPSPVSPGGTLRQPSHFQLQSAPKGWRPVTPPATSPISQQPIQPNWYNQQQQQDHRAQVSGQSIGVGFRYIVQAVR